MKKIGMCGPFDPMLCDGVSRSMFELLTFIRDLGHDVFVISMLHESDWCLQKGLNYLVDHPEATVTEKGDLYCRANLKGIDVYLEILPYQRHEILSSHIEVIKRTIRQLCRCLDSYIFSVDFDQTSLLAKSLLGIPGAHFIHSPSSIAAYTRKPMHRELLQRTTVFAASRFSQKKLMQMLGIQAVVWYPFIDLGRFNPKERSDRKRVVGFYSAGSHKGDELVHHLIRKLPSVHFEIMGRNYSYPADVRCHNVKYTPDVTDLSDYYKKISLMLVPSISGEGFSRVVLEAAKNGVPAIANNIGGIPEALNDSGVIVDTDPSLNVMIGRYISAIRKLLENPAAYDAYRLKAVERSKVFEEELRDMSMRYYGTHLTKATVPCHTSLLKLFQQF